MSLSLFFFFLPLTWLNGHLNTGFSWQIYLLCTTVNFWPLPLHCVLPLLLLCLSIAGTEVIERKVQGVCGMGGEVGVGGRLDGKVAPSSILEPLPP